jgi:hypothetical protein
VDGLLHEARPTLALEQRGEAGGWKRFDLDVAHGSLMPQACRVHDSHVTDENLDEALERYETMLDTNFMDSEKPSEAELARAMEPFDAIETLLANHAEWKRLERSHRKMIVRIKTRTEPAFVRLQARLFDQLGEIYCARLGHDTSARASFEMAQQLDPDNLARTEGVDRAARLATLPRDT